MRLLAMCLVIILIGVLAGVGTLAARADDCAPEAMNSIAGKVFADANANGVLDDGETGTEGVTMRLVRDDDGDAKPGKKETVLDTQSTDWYGDYVLQVCGQGTYLIQPDTHTLPRHETLSSRSYAAVTFEAVGQAATGINFGHAQKRFVESQVIVGFKDGTPSERIQTIINEKGNTPLWEVPGINAWVIATPPGRMDQDIDDFNTPDLYPEVKWAEPNYVGGDAPPASPPQAQETQAATADANAPVVDEGVKSTFPDDPDFADPTKGYGPHQVGAPAAWNISLGRSAIIVAVVDTGVSPIHPELSAALLPGWDFVNNDGDASDDNGHGTHVAGIMAAAINNEQGSAGVAAGVRILPVKVLNSANSGNYATFAAGIDYAVQHGARVINLSLGGPNDSQALHDAIIAATNQGALVVAAAGNTADNRAWYPGSYAEALSVGGTNMSGGWWDQSTFNSDVDLAAPADTVWSTYWRSDNPGAYEFLSGTSMAAPFVSAAAALLLSNRPDLTPGDLQAILEQTAFDVGGDGLDAFTGYGRLDVGAALAASGAWSVARATATPTATPTPPAYVQRVNAGGKAFPNATAATWAADQAFTAGGWGYVSGSAKSSTSAVNGTTDDALYQKYREGMTEYRFTLPNGDYQVMLKFAEFGTTTVGERVMKITIEGVDVETGLDVYKTAGKATALDRTYQATVSDGLLNIAFTKVSGRKAPMVSAIAVAPALPPTPTPTFTPTITPGGPTLTPTPTATFTPTPIPYLQRVNAGGALFTDGAGDKWAADQGMTGSWGYVGGSAKSSSTVVNGTSDGALYQKYREGMSEYQFTVPNGNYEVTLKFAEFGTTTVGDRVMKITLEGADVETGLDVYKTAGKATALDRTYQVTVGDGVLNIAFTKVSGRKSPMVSAILMQQVSGPAGGLGGTATPLPTESAAPAETPTPAPFGGKRANAGGVAYTDAAGQTWDADQAYDDLTWGYTGGTAKATTKPVAGTLEAGLYQQWRENPGEYRFVVPDGVYDVTLHFVEFEVSKASDRIMTITIEDTMVENALSVFGEVGSAAALSLTYRIQVNDGVLNISFSQNGGHKPPIVAAIEVQPG